VHASEIQNNPSPNFGPRKGGLTPSIIVIHYTAMDSAEAAIQRLCDPAFEVSAHYLVASTGQITRMVAEDQRAWHAGAGSWCGQDDINSRSIGIELDNRGDHPFAEPQMAALEKLLADVMARWQIKPGGVIGHSDMAPDRKIDPGPHFDWHRLALQGLAARGERDEGPRDSDYDSFRQIAEAAGYTAPADDASLLRAVRMRYRPFAKGPLCGADYAPLGHTALWT
jgi:N-acetylmuramoyl-L-alanine amidase